MLIGILSLFCIICLLIIWKLYHHKVEIDNSIAEENKKLVAENVKLVNEQNNLKRESEFLTKEIDNRKQYLKDEEERTLEILDTQKKLSDDAFKNYWDVLDNKYKETEEEYDEHMQILRDSYDNLQLNLMAEMDEVRADLDKIRNTRAAAIDAIRKEKEIKEKQSFYCIKISDIDKADIAKLENIKPSLSNPRILSMLIWQTYYQKPLKALSANVLGQNDITGIYKITNQKTDECYIGQARNIKDRWNEHAKCGLGIDTPPGNKLYKAMQEYGLYNFSWELLEVCPPEQLNEKERTYIDIYQSCDYGYNSNKGVTK